MTWHQTLSVRLVLVLSMLGCCLGCGKSDPLPSQSSATFPSDKQALRPAIDDQSNGATAPTAPTPVIKLATPPGWTKSETRPLPTDDHGFTVAYEHESGAAVTLYQFTRGLNSIPDDVTSEPVREEMNRARRGIEQSVELGYYQYAKLYTSDTVALGDSNRKALWAQYHLTIDELKVVSDIYVWSYANTFFKLRCTSRSEDVVSNHEVLGPLLTSLGSPEISTGESRTDP